MHTRRAPYSGSSRKLVLAFDVGTTFSGVAYAFIDPGHVPEIRPVTKYLYSSNVGAAKVPSTFYYNHDGTFRGIEGGADTEDSDELLRMKWWKLMLSPSDLPAVMTDQMNADLPSGKTIVDVFADFMRYLFHSARKLFRDSEPNGELRWNSISGSIELVLTHPNGWGGPQQTHLRNAAVKAGIVQDTPAGRSRVHFVSEGEASFSFCAVNTEAGKNLKRGEQTLIIDAGGGTIDISTYKVLGNGPLRVKELYESKCLVQGGEIVTARATAMVREKLRGSRFDNDEDLEAFSQRFDEGVKKSFSNSRANQFVKFGSPRDNEPNYGISRGKLTLTGEEVSGLFEPSIQSTVDSIRDNFKQRLPTNSFAFLVGGFADSAWLSEQLQQRLLDLGFRFCKPDTHTNKAVAIGAVSYYIDRFVTARVSKFTYGVPCCLPYDSSNPEHARRFDKSSFDATGRRRVPGAFDTMLTRGTSILEDREIRTDFCIISKGGPPQRCFSDILKYTGALAAPKWKDVEPDKFEKLCRVEADISSAPYVSQQTTAGGTSYIREYDVILLVGLTELKAQVSWIDKRTGKEKRFVAMLSEFLPRLNPTPRSNAVVIYDDYL